MSPSKKAHKDRFRFFKKYWKLLLVWVVIIAFVEMGILLSWDKKVIGLVVALFGIITSAFTGMVALISLVPLVGPLVAKVLTIPIIWILNALGYFVSIIAIKKGFKKEVLDYRVLTVSLLTGVVIGYVLGKLI